MNLAEFRKEYSEVLISDRPEFVIEIMEMMRYGVYIITKEDIEKLVSCFI